ncbi:hypothetical protein ZHAS_00019939 [Anopheles sinensis]|uniref:Uncharacterized protein n=1 Tax=Anopheles sinensis TaxID=74873 RepID=A0A084WNJ3_ANOSI|nr:hypothetical protein ZHAS_00019939 [Anopheles sinensis]
MVNKQYNVHNPKLHKSTAPSKSSPAPLRSFYPAVSTRPAGTSDEDRFSVESDSNNASSDGGSSVGGRHRQLPPPPPPPTAHPRTQGQAQNNLSVSRRATPSPGLANRRHEQDEGEHDGLYGRNIQFYSEGRVELAEGEAVGENGGGRYGGKELSISDIGRFQYILQMDREVVNVLLITLKV